MIFPQYNQQAPPTCVNTRWAALCEIVRRGLGQEASIGKPRSGGVDQEA